MFGKDADGLADPAPGCYKYRLRIDELPVVKQGTAEPQGQNAVDLQWVCNGPALVCRE